MSAFTESELAEDELAYTPIDDGPLIHLPQPTSEDDNTEYLLHLDGFPVSIKKAVPATDARGNVRRDAHGAAIPRYTTIYDAARKACQSQAPGSSGPSPHEPIPILCHREHLKPVGVCRVCSVLVAAGPEGAPVKPRLIPACSTELRSYFENTSARSDAPEIRVYTHNATELVRLAGRSAPVVAGEYVRSAVETLLRLLLAYHRHGGQTQQDRYHNELEEIASWPGLKLLETAGSAPFRLLPPRGREVDGSSPAFLVDHNNCILCNRCIRGCADVRGFHIIGQAGKGSNARIGFDLDRPMGESGCVACGECMISCPTGAITFKSPMGQVRSGAGVVPADEVARDPLFARLPKNFLKWTEGEVTSPACMPQEPLCEEGDPGATAYVLRRGTFEIRRPSRFGTKVDRIVAKSNLLNDDPRSATVVPMTDDCAVWGIGHNVLKMLLRDRAVRGELDRRHCDCALDDLWSDCQDLPREPTTHRPAATRHRWLFANVTEEQRRDCIQVLRDRLQIVRVAPGQVILREGQRIDPEPKADDPADGLFLIRAGFVEVSRRSAGRADEILELLGPGDHFGEIALLSLRSTAVAARLPGGPTTRGQRISTCRARGHVELIRIPARAFLELLERFPSILAVMERSALAPMAGHVGALHPPDPRFGEFVRQELFQGQDLLVIDLDRCTRCQECVKGCADSHGGLTRLILEGERFDRFLVPSACRSCHDPLCLTECPADAIHRRSERGSLAIVIDENRCIGCGLCALNCPFGSIHMLETPDRPRASLLATNCDLCESAGRTPQCVHVCPHDAARRMTGHELGQSLGLFPLSALDRPRP
jgi:Fe-S-cluster-containing hydrogenase component 2